MNDSVMEQGVENSEKRRKLDDLIYIVKTDVLKNHAAESSKLMGHWRPVFYSNPERMLPYLLDVFTKLRGRFHKQDPILLECGAGYGVVASVGAMAGFSVKAIEIQESMNSEAKRYNKLFEEKRIFQSGKVQNISGSYYFQEVWQNMRNHYINANIGVFEGKSTQSEVAGLAADLGIKVNRNNINTLTKDDILSRLSLFDSSADALRNNGIADNTGKIHVDCIFGYISDAFALQEYGFIEQMRDGLRKGAILAFVSNQFTIDAQEQNRFSGFVKEEEIQGSNEDPIIEVFRRL